MFSELARASIIIVIVFLPLFFAGLWGLYKLRKFELILFVFGALIAALLIDLRIMITVQFVLLIGFVKFFEEHKKSGVIICIFTPLLLFYWWLTNKMFYFHFAGF